MSLGWRRPSLGKHRPPIGQLDGYSPQQPPTPSYSQASPAYGFPQYGGSQAMASSMDTRPSASNTHLTIAYRGLHALTRGMLTSITSIRFPTVWRPSGYDASRWTSLCWSTAVELGVAMTVHIALLLRGGDLCNSGVRWPFEGTREIIKLFVLPLNAHSGLHNTNGFSSPRCLTHLSAVAVNSPK